LYAIWVLLVFTLFMLLLLPFMISPILFGEVSRGISFKAIKVWATIFSKLTGIQYKAEGIENLHKYPAYIYVSNHTSFLDAPAMPLFIPGQFRPLGKKELGKIPVLGAIVKTVCVMVDRSSVESRRKSVDKLVRLIKKGVSIFIFPEGTMNRSDLLLKPFYDGAFRIAVETKAPILPMVIINAGKLLPPGTGRVKPGTIYVKFAKPIVTENLNQKDVPFIKAKAFEAMEQMMKDHYEKQAMPKIPISK
jgi:1-acyl-sn-glycerol-3-phosphate acyltransferase